MPQFIVRAAPASKDGSTIGGGIIVVTAASEKAAKIIGANDLQVPITAVIAEPYAEGTALWANPLG
jgi:hypothetical protein